MSRFHSSVAAMGLCLVLAGCGSGIHDPNFDPNAPYPPTSPSDPGNTTGGNTSGNWSFIFTPASGTSTLRTAFGSIDQSGGMTAQGQFTTSVLSVAGDCYNDTPLVPTQGFATSTQLSLNSFGAGSQFIGMNLTIANGGNSLSGSYTVTGGCAGGTRGSLTGIRYTSLTGNYAGTLTGTDGSSRTLSLALKQSTQPAGNATFLLTGTASFTGFTCFQTGTTGTQTTGYVSGPTAGATFVTNEVPASRVLVSGLIDTGATKISTAQYVVQGGACNGQTGTGTIIATP